MSHNSQVVAFCLILSQVKCRMSHFEKIGVKILVNGCSKFCGTFRSPKSAECDYFPSIPVRKIIRSKTCCDLRSHKMGPINYERSVRFAKQSELRRSMRFAFQPHAHCVLPKGSTFLIIEKDFLWYRFPKKQCHNWKPFDLLEPRV